MGSGQVQKYVTEAKPVPAPLAIVTIKPDEVVYAVDLHEDGHSSSL